MREPPGPLWGRAASLCLLPRQISGRRAACPVGRAAVCAGGRRPAREIATREPDGSEWSISRPALALPPPTGTAARPSGTLQSVGVYVCCRLVFATARGHRSQALRRPPHLWGLVC